MLSGAYSFWDHKNKVQSWQRTTLPLLNLAINSETCRLKHAIWISSFCLEQSVASVFSTSLQGIQFPWEWPSVISCSRVAFQISEPPLQPHRGQRRWVHSITGMVWLTLWMFICLIRLTPPLISPSRALVSKGRSQQRCTAKLGAPHLHQPVQGWDCGVKRHVPYTCLTSVTNYFLSLVSDTAARQSPMEAIRRSVRKLEEKRYAVMVQRNIIGQVCHTPKSYDNVMHVGLRKVTFKWQRGNKIGMTALWLHLL